MRNVSDIATSVVLSCGAERGRDTAGVGPTVMCKGVGVVAGEW